MKKPKVLHNFYKSEEWRLARHIKITQAQGRCERCNGIGEEVHHKIRLTVNNVNDVMISINQDNLELLCKECHNKEHNRFKKKHIFDNKGNYINL